jgi:hypothetical protein
VSNRTRASCVLCFAAFAVLGTICNVGAASSSDRSALNQAALAFVKNVVGIGVDAYNVTSDCKGPMNSLLYPGHTEAVVSVSLSGAGSQLEIEIEFIDSYLVSYRLTSCSGQAALAAGNSSGILRTVKDTLGRYQTVFDVTYASQLATMAGNIVSLDRTKTIETEPVTMRFAPNATLGCSFTWICKNATRKSLGISVNKEGVLYWFMDMWGINKVSNSQVNVSEQTALRIASDNANAYAKRLGATVAKVNVTFEYINSYPDARGGDPFVLYPSWNLEFSFDSLYSDSQGQHVSGYFVGVWADTGEVRAATPEGFWGQSPELSGNSNGSLSEFGFVAVAILVVAGALVLTVRKRHKQNKTR